MNKRIRPTILYALLRSIPISIGLLCISLFIRFLIPEILDMQLLYIVICGLLYIYKVLLIRSHSYTFTSEQIIYNRGVFSIYTDYIELYRIKDFKEQRPFLLRLIGCMNIVLISSDRSVPNLCLKGVPSQRIMLNLRNQVEQNRTNKRVFEVD